MSVGIEDGATCSKLVKIFIAFDTLVSEVRDYTNENITFIHFVKKQLSYILLRDMSSFTMDYM